MQNWTQIYAFISVMGAEMLYTEHCLWKLLQYTAAHLLLNREAGVYHNIAPCTAVSLHLAPDLN